MRARFFGTQCTLQAPQHFDFESTFTFTLKSIFLKYPPVSHMELHSGDSLEQIGASLPPNSDDPRLMFV